uniref:Uncharacterized protein n=1 Tax=Hanusia phi TaxID=3032 RepID=A0A7S0E7E1_9CRYP|mmetsp:Transcript_18381/g.41850  ORF Transcript_18381/g.41850 Transcript_18381/m.41850 type:complete len:261 (+) Transcript_18381:57-839(+)
MSNPRQPALQQRIHARVPDVPLVDEALQDDDQTSQPSPSFPHYTSSPRRKSAVDVLINADGFGVSPFKSHIDLSDNMHEQEKAYSKPRTDSRTTSLNLTKISDKSFSSFEDEADSYRWYRRSGWRTQRAKLFSIPISPMFSSYARLGEHVRSQSSNITCEVGGDYLLDKRRLKRGGRATRQSRSSETRSTNGKLMSGSVSGRAPALQESHDWVSSDVKAILLEHPGPDSSSWRIKVENAARRQASRTHGLTVNHASSART